MRSRSALCRISVLLLILGSGRIYTQTTPDMLENALQSVVTVAVYKTDHAKKLLGFRGPGEAAYSRSLDLRGALSSGSGFVVEYKGKKYIITNAHVIEEANLEDQSIAVFSINQTMYPVKIKGGDSFYDFAILEFQTEPGNEISSIMFSTLDPRVGQKVYAIGNPLGEYPYSISDGIISAKNRVRGGITGRYGFIQSTATLIYGNSGGPLVNEAGEVVGVNSQIAFAQLSSGSLWQSQINFSLEAAICLRLMNNILDNMGVVKRAYLGIEAIQRTKYEMDQYTDTYYGSLLDERPLLSYVFPDAPSYPLLQDKLGYQILEINGVETRNTNELLGELEKMSPGTSVKLTLGRDEQISTVEIATIQLHESNLNNIVYHHFDSPTVEERVQFQQDGENVFLMVKGDEGSSEAYRIVSMGLEDYHNVWKINSVSDLGTALRLFGLIGQYELVLADKYNPYAETTRVAISLSGKENITSSTIWY